MTRRVLVFAILASLLVGLGGFPAVTAPAPAKGPTRVLIGFKHLPGPPEHAAVQELGGAVGRSYRTFPVLEATVSPQAIEALKRNPNVTFVEEELTRVYGPLPETLGKPGGSTQPPELLPWGVNRIDAEYAWAGSPGYVGSGINVAVLDTGIDTGHPDLKNNLAGGFSAVGGGLKDNYGHGTFVSGVIAAVNNSVGVVGVGPQIRLWMVRVSSAGWLFMGDILEGIDWVNRTHGDSDPNNDIQVMNMSFGGGYSQAEDVALQASYDLGILPVASAGNSGGAVGYPAALPQVVAVSATERTDALASFSSRGAAIELAAPGVDIQSTTKGGGYGIGSGTSFSAPHVVGVAALAISAGKVNGLAGAARSKALREHLQTTALDLGTAGKDNLYGYGLIDAEKATKGTTSGDNLAEPKPAP